MTARRILTATMTLAVSAVLVSCITPGTASAQFTLNESGFDVTVLGTSTGPKGAACSPGGVWGDYVYIDDSSGDAVERIDFADDPSPFASGAPDIQFPVGMAFGPGPANDFGTYLYVASYGSGRITRLDPSGSPSLFVNFPNVSDVTFDPTGAYSTDLFAISYFGAISTVTPGGVITPFANFQSSYFRFGPGGAWGTGLYATSAAGSLGVGIVTVDSGGSATLFTGGMVGPEQFDWATGGSFGGDMFASDMSDGKIYRVKPDGTKTVWATLTRPAGITFCNNCLYVTSYAGGCWKVCESPTPVKPTSWGAIKQAYRSEGDGSVPSTQE